MKVDFYTQTIGQRGKFYVNHKSFIRLTLVIFCFLFAVNSAKAATYYLTAAGAAAANVASSWNTVAAGGGTAASNFTTNGDNFIVPIGISGTMAQDVTFGSTSGSGVILTVYGTLTFSGSKKLYLCGKNFNMSSLIVNGSIIFSGTSAAQILSSVAGTLTANVVTIASGAFLKTPNINGIFSTNGSIKNSAITFTGTGANYEFSGAAQAMTGIPSSIGNLTLSGSGTKTFPASLTIGGNLSIGTGVAAGLGNVTSYTAVSLDFNGTSQVTGTWGRTTSSATNKNNTYFIGTSGIITISSCGTPGLWVGGTSTAWATATNWCGGAVPTSTTNVIINSGGNQPSIGAAAVCKNITINSGATLTVSGAYTLTVSGNWVNSGTFTPGSSTVNFNFAGAQTVGTGPFNNLTLSGTGAKTLTGVVVNGILSMEGTATATGTPTFGGAATLQYKGTASVTTSTNEFPNAFAGTGGLIIDQGSGNTVTLDATKTALAGSLNIKSGTLDLLTYTANRTSGTTTLTVAAGACLRIGGTNTLPSGYTTHSMGCSSTIEYYGTNQTVANLNSSQTYGNLTLSGSGTKTLQTATTTICSSLTLSGTVTVTAVVGLTIGSNVDIGLGTSFTAGAFTHLVGGNWTKNGTFTATGSTLNFNGSNAANIGASNFNHVIFSGAGAKTAVGALLVVGNLSITNNFSGGSYIHSLQSSWTNSGTYTANTSTISFIGSTNQSVGGTSSTTFNNVTMAGTGGATLGIASSIAGVLTLTTGKLDIGNYNLVITSTGSVSGGSATSYIKTSGTGIVKQTVASSITKTYAIGRSAYNPITITNNSTNGSDNFNIRVTDDAITNANNNLKTVNRRWYLTEDAAGTTSLTVAVTYNAGEAQSGFNASSNPKAAYFSGSYWAYATASVVGTTFTASAVAANMITFTDPFIAIGSDDAFSATKLAVSSISPTNPTVGLTNSIITVQSQNSLGVPTRVYTNTAFDLSCLNTAFTPTTPTGTINAYASEITVTGITFTESTYNLGTTTYDHDATVTATRTSGESLSAGTSAVFDVYDGAIWEPIATENWDASNGWKKSADGGSTWTNPAALPSGNNFSATDIIRVPLGITLTVNVTVSFYSMLVLGTLDINSSGSITVNHTTNDLSDYDIYVNGGTLKNSGGTLTNSNNAYPIEIHGGTYWHNRNGGSIPVATWTSIGATASTCNVTGITSTALTGLNQSFQNFTWNNAGQSTTVQYLSGDMMVSGDLVLTNGILTTDVDHVIEAASGSISRTNGYINGNVRLYVPNASAPTVTFPIGDANYYAPVSVTFSGTTAGSGYLDGSTSVAAPPSASGLSQTKYINRKWTVRNNGVTGYTTYSMSFTFDNADKVGSPTTASLKLRQITDYTWYTTNGAATGNTITATGLNSGGVTSFADFYVGEDDCGSTNLWMGSTSVDWNTGSNWCSGVVPTATTDVIIPSSPTFQPMISTAATCKNITIQSGASLTVSGSYTLDVKGNWSNSGTYTASTGTVSFTASSAQSITGVTTFDNLTVNNSAGVTSASSIAVNGLLTLSSANPDATHGTLDMGSNTLSMLSSSASVTGVGDLSGIIRRAHTFTPNVSYQFGSQYTTVNFMGTGTQPVDVSCKIVLGSYLADKSDAVLRNYNFFYPAGTTYTDKVVLNLRYLTSELNGNDETMLVLWDHHSSPLTTEPHGKTNNNTTNHWVGLAGLTFSYIAKTVVSDKSWGLSNYTTTKNVWIGPTSTDWNTLENWSAGHVPYVTDDVLIPVVVSGHFYPTLTSDVEIQSLEIAAPGTTTPSLTAETYSMTINGYTGAWQNSGTFVPGTGTVNFTHGIIGHVVSVSGTTQFNDINIAANTFVQPGSTTVIKISGAVSGDISCVVDLSTFGNTVEFNGTDQYFINPSTANFNFKGYCNLILNPSGTITFYGDSLDISGDLTVNGTVDFGTSSVAFIGTSAQTIAGSLSPTFNNLKIDNVSGVVSSKDITVNGELNLDSDNPSLTSGSLAMGSNTLNMGDNSTTTGIGDVTGIIKRTPSTGFALNTEYTYGNANTVVIFPTTSGQTLPTSASLRVTLGAAPVWGVGTPANAINRVLDLAQTGGSGTHAIFSTHFRLDELPGGINPNLLSIWVDKVGVGIYEKGKSNINTSIAYISVQDVDLALMTTSLNDFHVAVAPTALQVLTWNGIYSTDWNNTSNWTPNGVPSSSYGVLIPDANTTAFQPTLPATGSTQASCQYIILETASVLNAGNHATITISDGVVGDAWGAETGSTFNAGNSSVIFSTSGTDFASISGKTNFYDLTLTSDSKLRPAADCYIGIAGTLTNQGTLAAATNKNTFDFNGSDQTIPNLNGSTAGYYNLTLSGSGTKTLPSSALQVRANFNISGTADAVAHQALNIDGNIVIASSSTFTAGSYSHTLIGNWTNSGTFAAGTSTISFTGLNPQTIVSGVGNPFNNVTFNNASTTLSDVITINGATTFTAGIVSGSKMRLGSSATANEGKASSYFDGTMTKLGTSAFTFPIGNAGFWAPIGIAAPSDSVSAIYYHTTPPYNNWNHGFMCNSGELDHVSGLEYWELLTDGDKPAVTLHCENQTNSQVVTPADIVVAHWTGSCWESMNTVPGLSSDVVTSDRAFTSYSPITFGTKANNNPLPISLLDFAAQCDNNSISVTWTTATETNNDYFTVERSVDAKDWTIVAKVDGAGNSNTIRNYAMVDNNSWSGISYYRLKQTDFDGKSEYFSPISVSCSSVISNAAIHCYPNPFTTEFTVDMRNLSAHKANLLVYDILGNKVYERVMDENDFLNQKISINLTNLPQGIYTVQFIADSFSTTSRLVKSK
ncbi:MAG: T9SS type A sorting domain-containing protein [Bacteroidota bacterium]